MSIDTNFLTNASLALGIIQVIVSFLLERTYEQRKITIVILLSVPALIASFYSLIFLSDPQNHSAWAVITIFLTSSLLWATFFHIAAMNFGHNLTRLNIGRFSIISRNWVKAIDYIYLLLSTFSILRIVVSAVANDEGYRYFSAFSAVVLGFAVALRITRTSVEIFGWDKPPSVEISTS